MLPKKLSAFLILGAPGSGKGTQGAVLGSVPHFFHCACGDVFRSLDVNSPLGQKFSEYSSRGELVPDELTIELWHSQILRWAEGNQFKPESDFLILDGIPRNVRQAEILQDYVEVHQIFHLSCPNREELARRMRSRALKQNRVDDASDVVIQNRIATYEAETKPILEFYDPAIICDVDASMTPLDVLGRIISQIQSLPVYQESVSKL